MTRKVIITAAAGLASFAGAFAFAWLTSPSPASQSDPSGGAPLTDSQSEQAFPPMGTGGINAVHTASAPMKKTMTEQQLKNLIQNIREKMLEYDKKLQGLAVREKRLQVAQDVFTEDIENLKNLQVELASTLTKVKSERDRLVRSRLEIDTAEKINLVSIAATYDKMEASSASKILTNMCGAEPTERKQNVEALKTSSSFDDAVRILHYMTERTKAKLLAELAISEPELAAALCKRLKQIVEEE